MRLWKERKPFLKNKLESRYFAESLQCVSCSLSEQGPAVMSPATVPLLQLRVLCALKNRICTTLEHLAAEDALQKSQFSKSPVLLGSALPTARRAQHSAPSAYCTAASCMWEAERMARACAQEASGSGEATKLAPGQFDEEKKGSHEPKLEASRIREEQELGSSSGSEQAARAGCAPAQRSPLGACTMQQFPSSGCLCPAAALSQGWSPAACSSAA